MKEPPPSLIMTRLRAVKLCQTPPFFCIDARTPMHIQFERRPAVAIGHAAL